VRARARAHTHTHIYIVMDLSSNNTTITNKLSNNGEILLKV